MFFGESFSALVVVRCSKGDGVSVEELFVGVVVAGFVDRESLSRDGDSVYRDLDDATVCPDGVWTFSAGGAGYVHDVVREFFADEVLEDVYSVVGAG